jgi:SAM-dependent methyltransferase
VRNFSSHEIGLADIAVAIGILHHLDDAIAANLLRAAARVLKPGGRMIMVDPCYHAGQTIIQRFVVSHDRGAHVRPFERYVELAERVFPGTQASLRSGHLPFPYSQCVMQAVRGDQ